MSLNVRFAPESGHSFAWLRCPFSATAAVLMKAKKVAPSLS